MGFAAGCAVLVGVLGCHRGGTAEGAPTADSVKASFAGLKKQFGDLQQRFADLGKQVEAIPSDLPGYPQLRARFYGAEEARGVADARVTLLSASLDVALASRRGGELAQVSKDIEQAQGQAGQIDQLYLKLLHQVLAFERAAEQRLVAK